MKKVNFTPKTDVEAYLTNNFNIEIFHELTEDPEWKGLFEPLDFFNLLYEQFRIVRANKKKPVSVRNHLLKLDLDKHQFYYFIHSLQHLIYTEIVKFISDDDDLYVCYSFILKEYDKIGAELFPESKAKSANLFRAYDFEEIKEYLETLPDPKEKIKFLVEIKTQYNQNLVDLNLWEEEDEESKFILMCEMEISKIKELLSLEQLQTQIPLEQLSTPPDTKFQLGRYTNSQIVLIFYYFFKHSRLEPRVNIDIAPIAKFIHLIIGKELTSITNSDFYKKLQAAPNFKTDKELINDLEAIKPLFKKVLLNEIVKMIENEIDIARAEIKQTKKK